MLKGQLLRGWYALSQGVTTAASTASSVYQWTKSIPAAVAGGAIGLVGDIANSLIFQGKSILDQCKRRPTLCGDVSPPSNKKTEEKKPNDREECTFECTWSHTKQILYTSLDASKTFFNRYFILSSFFTLMRWNPSSPLFWTYLGSSLFIKQLFNMAHETFETADEIAGPKRLPYFSFILKFCHRVLGCTNGFIRAGSGEHTINDDLLPWLTLLPQEAVDFLNENPAYWATLAPLLILTYLIYQLTYRFEGKHAEENIKKASEVTCQCCCSPSKENGMTEVLNQETKQESVEIDEEKKPETGVFCCKTLKCLKTSLLVMGPLHAGATLVPTYLTLLELLKNYSDPVKYTIATAVSTFFGAGTGLGVHYSEVCDARDEIDAEIAKQEKQSGGYQPPVTHNHSINAIA